MVRFVANVVVVDDSNEEFLLVGFAYEQDGAYVDMLHLQRVYSYDDQDVALGMDRVYVQRDDQSRGGYGDVQRCELRRDSVLIAVDDNLAKVLGDAQFEISFALAREEFDRLCNGLRTILVGSDALIDCAP
jgi:hypothetical protein